MPLCLLPLPLWWVEGAHTADHLVRTGRLQTSGSRLHFWWWLRLQVGQGACISTGDTSDRLGPVVFLFNIEYILRILHTPPCKSIPEHFHFLKPTYVFENFIDFCLHGVFSGCGGRGPLSSAACRRLAVEHGLQWLRLPDSRAQAQSLMSTGLAAPTHVGSSWPRDRTCVPCVGRRILSDCTTREAQT